MLRHYYELECDGCGELSEIHLSNPRFELVGWANGNHYTPLPKNTKPNQYAHDLCPDCVGEGARFERHPITRTPTSTIIYPEEES
jgi:hypothetical protein